MRRPARVRRPHRVRLRRRRVDRLLQRLGLQRPGPAVGRAGASPAPLLVRTDRGCLGAARLRPGLLGDGRDPQHGLPVEARVAAVPVDRRRVLARLLPGQLRRDDPAGPRPRWSSSAARCGSTAWWPGSPSPRSARSSSSSRSCEATDGRPIEVATDLAYPLGDLLMLALVIGVFALTGWRPGRAWAFIGAGLMAMAAADSIYAYQASKGIYIEGTVLDALWPAATLLVGWAAWVPEPPQGAHPPARLAAAGAADRASALLAVGVLVYDHFARVDTAADRAGRERRWSRCCVRTAMTFGENLNMLRNSQREALTDALTGLGNRRALMNDLRDALEGADRRQPARADPVRPRRLQALQRLVRPPGGRRAAGAARAGRSRRPSATTAAPTGSAATSSARSSTADARPGPRRDRRRPRWRSPSTARASRSPRRTASCCCRARRTTPPPPCRSPTSGCTATRARGGARRSASRRATCCCRCCTSASPSCTTTTTRSPTWPWRSARS